MAVVGVAMPFDSEVCGVTPCGFCGVIGSSMWTGMGGMLVCLMRSNVKS